MIASAFQTPHLPVDPAIDKPIGDAGAEQQVIEAQPGVAPPRIPQVVPEGVDLRVRVPS